MSFITKTALKYFLKDIKNFDEVRDVCSKHSSMCRSEKQLICKKTLQVSGYSVPNGTDSCSVYKELLELAKTLERPYNVTPIYVDQSLINSVEMYGSKAVQEFFIKNGYNIRVRRMTNILSTNKVSNAKDNDTAKGIKSIQTRHMFF